MKAHIQFVPSQMASNNGADFRECSTKKHVCTEKVTYSIQLLQKHMWKIIFI